MQWKFGNFYRNHNVVASISARCEQKLESYESQ